MQTTVQTITVHRNGYDFQYSLQRPILRFFGGASKPKAPAPIAPIPTPRQLDEDVRMKDEARRKQRIAAAGRGGTILNTGLSLSSGNATILGRSTS